MLRSSAEAVSYSCWAAAAVVWAAGALRTRRSAAPAERSGHDLASPTAAVVGIAVVLSPACWWRPWTTEAAGVLVAGQVLVLAATAWTILARVALGSMWASGIVARHDHELRTGGIYGLTRHPVYTGIIGMLLGTTLALSIGRWIGLTVIVTLILGAKARGEERALSARFPAEYEDYRRRVPMLVPWPSRSRS